MIRQCVFVQVDLAKERGEDASQADETISQLSLESREDQEDRVEGGRSMWQDAAQSVTYNKEMPG